MKDSSTLKTLNRKLDVEFKESQLYLSKLENIFSERIKIEEILLNQLEQLTQEEKQVKKTQEVLFLSGKLSADGTRVEQLRKEKDVLKQKLRLAQKECLEAQKRIDVARIELERFYREKEGILKIGEERDLNEERIKIESTDSN